MRSRVDTRLMMAAAIVLAGILLTLLTATDAAAATSPCTGRDAGGSWPSYGHDHANTRSQPDEHAIGPAAVSKLTVDWVFSTTSTQDGSGFNATPIVDGGCVFVGSAGGFAYALDASDGHVIWQSKLDDSSSGPAQAAGGALVGSPAITGDGVVFLVNGAQGPYAVKLDRSTGAMLWRSPVFQSGSVSSGLQSGYYTDASAVVANGLVIGGYSCPSGNDTCSGGFALVNASTGKLVKVTPTIPDDARAAGYAGGGLWSTPAYDRATRYLYWGSGNPYSTNQYPTTDAILKIDLDRRRSTFGEIVGAYEGNTDQYVNLLQPLSQTPVCQVSTGPGVSYPFGNTPCGQLDLDFGASANLFETSSGQEVVGELQKSGVYHVARADTMATVWSATVGAPCQICNADSTAFDGTAVLGKGSTTSEEFSLAQDTGTLNWLAPVGDGSDFLSTSVADGVVWTEDANGFLDAFSASNGSSLARRPLSADVGAPVFNGTSSGVAIAAHKVIAEFGGYAYFSTGTPGYVVAYALPQ